MRAQGETTERATSIRYQSMGWLTSAAVLAYLSRNAVGVAESTIRENLALTLQQSGWFMGAFFWTYAIFQVPSGWFAQKKGTRLTLTVFAMTWSLATLSVGLAPGLWLLILGQLLMGTAQAGIFPAACNSISHWIPLGRRTLACGILAAGMQVGAIAASGLTGEIMHPFGWRWVFVIFALPGIVWAVLFFLRFRDSPRLDPRVNPKELTLIHSGRDTPPSQASEQIPHGFTPWKAIARNPTIYLLCGQQICRAAGYMFFASWFPTFLQETRGVSIKDSGYLQALVLAGTLLGCIFGGLLTDWIWRWTQNLRVSRAGVGAGFLFGCALLILMAWFVKNVSVAVALLAAGSLCAALAGPCAFSATIDIGGHHVPQVFGLMNMTGNFAAAACPILVGYLFSWTENWNLVLVVFAAVYFAGALCWVFVDPGKRISSPPEA